eukprot:Lankesteria_metandrocarpae@DN5108_c0_g2_i2.p1
MSQSPEDSPKSVSGGTKSWNTHLPLKRKHGDDDAARSRQKNVKKPKLQTSIHDGTVKDYVAADGARPASASSSAGEVPEHLQGDLKRLLEEVRKDLGAAHGVKLLKNIVSNDGLSRIARAGPTTAEELAKLSIPGLTAKTKRDKYGPYFLKAVAAFLSHLDGNDVSNSSRAVDTGIQAPACTTSSSNDALFRAAHTTVKQRVRALREEYVTVGGHDTAGKAGGGSQQKRLSLVDLTGEGVGKPPENFGDELLAGLEELSEF